MKKLNIIILLFVTHTSHSINKNFTEQERQNIENIIKEVDQKKDDTINDLEKSAIPFFTTRALINLARLANATVKEPSTGEKIALGAATCGGLPFSITLDSLLLPLAPLTISGSLIHRAILKNKTASTRYKSTKDLLKQLTEEGIEDSKIVQKIKNNVEKDLKINISTDELVNSLKEKLNPVYKDEKHNLLTIEEQETFKEYFGYNHPEHYKYNFPIGIKAISSFIASSIRSDKGLPIKQSFTEKFASKLDRFINPARIK